MAGMPHRLIALAASTLLAACFGNTSGVSPKADSEYLYYPIALGLTKPDGDYLVVVNSNFDLAFNSSVVVPIDLAKARDLAGACRRGESPCAEEVEFFVPSDDDVPRKGGGRDERFGVLDYLLEDHAVRIGSYAGTLALTEHLAIVPVRGDTSVTFIDLVEADDPASQRILRCATGEDADRPGSTQRCGEAHQVRSNRRLDPDEVQSLPSEPFSVVAWDEVTTVTTDDNTEQLVKTGNSFAVVGHMVSGDVSLCKIMQGSVAQPDECSDGDDDDGDGEIDASDPGCSGHKLELYDVVDDFNPGTSGIAVRPDDPNGRFIAASRSHTELSTFYVQDDAVFPSRTIAVGGDGGVSSDGDDQRGIAISPDGERAFVVSRAPAAVLVLDIGPGENGRYEDRVIDVIEVGVGPSIIDIYQPDEDRPDEYMVYVVCFDEDRLYAIDPALNEVVDVIATRRGPHDLAVDGANGLLYVANFLESTLSVIDVDPESDAATYHTVLTTLGEPRRPRSND